MSFASYLKPEKPSAVAQKKNKYENLGMCQYGCTYKLTLTVVLVAKLYHNVCERNKKGFRRNAQAPRSRGPTFSQTNGDDSQVSTSAEVEPHCLVKWDDDTVGGSLLQVKLIHEWTHKPSVASVKFSADGRHLAIGHSENHIDSQKTYIYDVATGRKVWYEYHIIY